ncbi:hypothetical protein CEXT_546231 [Caerostris extrusa]|uniref:Uncharacterized protein n=1 Tax=Caerostris extrusa TaxID=172846 RepID=A0AAV4MEW8_CAEEX|nr:hypothetical protein CEXT_546231 [Caerostris extrusa]
MKRIFPLSIIHTSITAAVIGIVSFSPGNIHSGWHQNQRERDERQTASDYLLHLLKFGLVFFPNFHQLLIKDSFQTVFPGLFSFHPHNSNFLGGKRGRGGRGRSKLNSSCV